MLAKASIFDRPQLENLGAIAAYLQVKESGQNVSLNLLYAIHAGLLERHWLDLSSDERLRLQLNLDESVQIKELFHGH